MDYSVNRQKMNQAIAYLKDNDIDLWLIMTSESSDPCLPLLTGVATVGQGAFLLTKSGEKYAVCSQIDAQDIEQSGLFNEVMTYSKCFSSVLKDIVKELSPKQIALNYSVNDHLADGLTTGRYRALVKMLENVFTGKYVSSEGFLTLLRSIKTNIEIEKIQKAVQVTQEIYDSVFSQIATGMTEKEVGQLFVEEMEKRNILNGIDRTLSMPIVMKENIAHRGPGDAVIKAGDLLIMDFSVDVDGYTSDVARTVYFLKEGEMSPPDDIQKVFNAVHQAISKAADTIKPGKKGHEVDLVARNHLLEHGLPDITHSTGHQMGRDVHDGGMMLAPKWERYGDGPYGEIMEGMVFTIEPTVFLDNDIHFIVEENVYVTEKGVEYLTKRQDDIILIPFHSS